MPDLIGRAARLGCPLMIRDLPSAVRLDDLDSGHWRKGCDAAEPILLWQEADDARARTSAILSGADEVIGPWMDRDEALARLIRLSKRPGDRGRRMVLGDLDIDLIAHSARRGGRALGLLAREYELLLHLARHCGRVQSRQTLLQTIWRLGFDPGTNVVQVHISRLRAKLDRGFARPMLHTVRGAGYCLTVAG
ncbi:response regulator transcription factor [Sphingobium sufflavum]|uniref:winged helix-turn-helix domain-containing protein n=1 Tax=Sphingobium sufflavum TaxID=1129547 RepID=UPI001F159F3A|nr:response regulator transcription factor [Sphingobium sufflavum]MCE7795234.1 response regulator transcription factor [Sphingobium sufflavum]